LSAGQVELFGLVERDGARSSRFLGGDHEGVAGSLDEAENVGLAVVVASEFDESALEEFARPRVGSAPERPMGDERPVEDGRRSAEGEDDDVVDRRAGVVQADARQPLDLSSR
jgi:hypothetical protein